MKKTGNIWSKGLFNNLVIIIIGILISMAGTAMLISGSFNLNKFYDVGAVYDMPKWELQAYATGMIYNYQENYFEIQEETATKVINIAPKQQGKWNYIYMKVSTDDNRKINCGLIYNNREGQKVYEKKLELNSGINIIVSEDISYSSIALVFSNQIGKKIEIDELQFREQEKIFTWKNAIEYFVIVYAVYSAIILIIKFIWKKREKAGFSVYSFIDKLQSCFIKAGDYAGNISGKYSDKTKRHIRTGVFLFLFFYMQIMSMTSKYLSIKWFKYHMYVCVIAILLLCIFSWEKPLHKLNWNHRFVRIWFGFWILAVISEFIVPKRYAYQGIIMILVMGFFFFIWNNRLDREEILRNFRKALELWFWINVPLCHLFSPFSQVTRYVGMSKNANIWAMYMIFVMAAFLSEAEVCFKETGRKKWIKGGCCFVAIGIIWDFIVKTGSASGMIPTILIIALWGIRQMKWMWNKQKKWQKTGYFLIGFVIVIFTSRVNDWGLRTITCKNSSGMIPVEEESVLDSSDNFMLDFFAIKAQAAGKIEENRVIKKFVESASVEEFTSGRNLFWIGYIREMNLWGHEVAPMLWGAHRSPHNGIIAITYRYGIFSLIPYAFLILYYMKYSFRYKEKKPKKSGIEFFIKAISINVLILLMMENVEFPFYYFSWYAFYLVMGLYFGNEPVEDQVFAEQ